MTSSWTPERRAKQAALIRQWKPWEQSTGPKSDEGKAISARNAWKGGTRPALRQLNAQYRQAFQRMQALQDELLM